MTLVVTGASKAYPGRQAVSAVSFAVEPGEILGLVGPSGCGKTTLLRLISGLDASDSGTISITGSADDRPRLAMVFQEDGLFPELTVAENVAYGLVEPDEEAVAVALVRMQLGQLRDRFPSQLSGGERRRVAVARALVVRPQVLLLDEPVSGLDESLKKQITREIVSAVRRYQVATVFVTHDQEEALSMSDRVAVMFDGRVVDIGPPRRVFDRPASVSVAGYLGRSNFLAVEVHSVADGRAAVRLFGREVVVPSHPEVTAAGASTLLVRPHSLALRRNLVPDVANRGQGIVLEVQYLGHGQDVVVETEDGTVVARMDSWSEEFAVGDVVEVLVNLDRVWLLPGMANL